jgi:hypothetical protein
MRRRRLEFEYVERADSIDRGNHHHSVRQHGREHGEHQRYVLKRGR